MRIRFLLLLAALLFAASSSFASENSSLTLLYTGNNYGTLRPCPT
ncbi:MAG: hypothetical protein PHX58_01100 [Desulfovibrio sp.]|jgi:hypothetical protein|nr:hypothetical protein [Desulfovibrio sp.]